MIGWWFVLKRKIDNNLLNKKIMTAHCRGPKRRIKMQKKQKTNKEQEKEGRRKMLKRRRLREDVN